MLVSIIRKKVVVQKVVRQFIEEIVSFIRSEDGVSSTGKEEMNAVMRWLIWLVMKYNSKGADET